MTHPEQIVPHGHVLRYAFRERLTHWVAAFSYLYLLATGLAFWSPWFWWLAVILGGGQISRMVHPWVGLIFVGSVFFMFEMWARQMRFKPVDKQWWNSLHYYITNQDDKMPPAGRYNAGQKLLFWTFFLAGIALLLSGLVLWFPEYISWNLALAALPCGSVHPLAALVTIGNFHDSHLHGRVCGTRCVWFRDSRRCFHGLREALSSRLVRGNCRIIRHRK